MKRTSFALVIAMGLVVGCGDDDAADDDDDDVVTYDAAPAYDAAPPPGDAGSAVLPEDLPSPLPTGAVDAIFTTYNTALTQIIVWPEERMPLLIEAVKGFDADVVCLQEVFVQYTNPKEFAEAVATEYPHSFWTWTQQHIWGNGVLILSKHPLYRGRELWFPTNDPNGNVDRMAIAADVVTDDSYFTVICTHLEAFSPGTRIPEIQEMKTWAEAEGYFDHTTILLGDMNCGPEPTPPCTDCDFGPDLLAYDELLLTWDDFAADLNECTYCRDVADPMQLIPPGEKGPDERLDHCMGVNYAPSTVQSTTVINKDVVTYTAGGSERMTPLSDHYGVRCVLAP